MSIKSVILSAIGLLLLHSGIATNCHGQDAAGTNKPAGFPKEFFEDLVYGALILPRIEDGKVDGLNPKPVKLLEYVLRDYSQKAKEGGFTGIWYCVTSGMGDGYVEGRTAFGEGKFKSNGLAPATYSMILGTQFEETRHATVAAVWQKADGKTKTIVCHIEWDGGDWREKASTIVPYNKTEVQEIRVPN